MARGKKTGGRDFKRGDPRAGRPKGSKDKVPRTWKKTAQEFFAAFHEEHPDAIDAAIARGLRAKPALAHRYVEICLNFAYGKPTETLEHSGKDGGPIRVTFGGRYKPPPAGAGA